MGVFKLVIESFLQSHDIILKNIDLGCMVVLLISDLVNFVVGVLDQLIIGHLLEVIDLFINSIELDIDVPELCCDVIEQQLVIADNLVVISNIKDSGLLS